MFTTVGSSRNWRQAARHGAGIGVKMALVYTVIFLLYAILRSTLDLLSLPAPDAGTLGTITATVLSLSVAAFAIAALLLPVSALAGTTLSLLLHLLLPQAGRRSALVGTLVISSAVAFAIADTVQLIVLPAAGFEPLDLPFETWLFWFGLPTLIYIIVAALEGRRLRSWVNASGGGDVPAVPVRHPS